MYVVAITIDRTLSCSIDFIVQAANPTFPPKRHAHSYCDSPAVRSSIPREYPILHTALLVKVELIRFRRALDLTSIGILQITLNNIVSVLPHCPQTRFLHDRCNDSAAQRIIPNN